MAMLKNATSEVNRLQHYGLKLPAVHHRVQMFSHKKVKFSCGAGSNNYIITRSYCYA
jgi:hypothetical protein